MTHVLMRTSGGLTQRNPTENRVRALIGALSRGDHVVIERVGAEGHYIQVWLRSDGVFQLEYRAGLPAEHYQALTDSKDEVASALSSWSKGEGAWRGNFEWRSIGDLFD